MRPGVDVFTTDQPPPRSTPTNTGAWFAVGKTGSGPSEATEVRSLKQYETLFGVRTGGPVLYDSVEAYFREGGGSAFISKTAADPIQGTAASALALFTEAMGPGQVSVPGISTSGVHKALIDHAAANNRVALCDGLETGTAVAQQALATGLKTEANARYGAIFGPFAVVPGLTVGTTRTVPFSAIVAGIIARNDEASGNPGLASAGVQGRSNFSLGLSAVYTDAEYQTLNEGGFDCAKLVYGEVQNYGWRSLVDPAAIPAKNWLSFGHARLNMGISALANAIGERYVFSQIDGKGLTIAQFGGELRAMLLPFWTAGGLYGATTADAFDVDVGAQVNTEQTIAAGELHAVIRLRMSPFAEWVVIEIVKVATTESVALAA